MSGLKCFRRPNFRAVHAVGCTKRVFLVVHLCENRVYERDYNDVLWQRSPATMEEQMTKGAQRGSEKGGRWEEGDRDASAQLAREGTITDDLRMQAIS